MDQNRKFYGSFRLMSKGNGRPELNKEIAGKFIVVSLQLISWRGQTFLINTTPSLLVNLNTEALLSLCIYL